MRLALVADTFPPLRSSGAVQLRDLSREFARQGHELTVMLPTSDLTQAWQLEEFDGVQILRLRAPQTKDIGYARRTMAELTMPFAMLQGLRRSPLASQRWDGVIWYSPSIFHGPLIRALKRSSGCKSYLIIRDIFPEWAVDMGLMSRGIPYHFFNLIARYQYSVADVIGVQTQGNLPYFYRWQKKPGRTLEVLANWLDKPGTVRCPIRIEQTALAGRKIFVYAGNMGIAQNMDAIVDLAECLQYRSDIGFVLVGRGSEAYRLKRSIAAKKLGNVLFYDEIDPDEISDLYRQCHAGIVSLDPRHRSHNIPGKFLTYMQSGLPVLANVNTGNDLAAIVRERAVGEVCESGDTDELAKRAEQLLSVDHEASGISERCRRLFAEQFSVERAVRGVVKHFD